MPQGLVVSQGALPIRVATTTALTNDKLHTDQNKRETLMIGGLLAALKLTALQGGVRLETLSYPRPHYARGA